jgi:signal transduction histidine kinase
LAQERAERVRAEEHAEVAAHLHDSVLQTLALIQRDSNATPDIKGLARHQERELRAWLFPDQATSAVSSGGFREALLAACAEAEGAGTIKIETVVVGDTAAPTEAIIKAASEAIRNAQTHSGAEFVSVYGEAANDEVLVFVKDRGIGFDPATVDASRHGVSESIVGRMDRSGGSAEIISSPGIGTEVRLRLPIEAS